MKKNKKKEIIDIKVFFYVRSKLNSTVNRLFFVGFLVIDSEIYSTEWI